MIYNIISTGSKGNAVILNDLILIDCGVPYRAIKPYAGNIQLVLLTHIHGDHFNRSSVHRLAAERPTLRFGCGKWLARDLIDCGVQKWRIDIFTPNVLNRYSFVDISMVTLNHNVPNCGYKIFMNNEKIFYATDTNDLRGITAKNYDLYMLEANYEDEEIKDRIRKKEENGEYAYERQVLHNHLSKAKCDDFIVRNAGIGSRFVYLHGHVEGEKNA